MRMGRLVTGSCISASLSSVILTRSKIVEVESNVKAFIVLEGFSKQRSSAEGSMAHGTLVNGIRRHRREHLWLYRHPLLAACGVVRRRSWSKSARPPTDSTSANTGPKRPIIHGTF